MRSLAACTLILAVSLAAAQSDSGPATLTQAIDVQRRESERLQTDVMRLGAEAIKAQTSAGPFHDSAIELRRRLARVYWPGLDVECGLLELMSLQRRRPSGGQKTLKDWLQIARQEKVAFASVPSRTATPAPEYTA